MEHINQLEPGTLLVGRYDIVKRVGGGGMGSVYLARDKRLAETSRAVKEMIGMFTDEAQRKKAIEDFERESQLLASLDHPSIPTIYDYFVNEGCYYLVMKYISGGDLQKRMKESPDGRVDEKTVVKWGIQVCDVLSYLHQREPPIIYRDMKPANIMLDERDHIMLVDFGIARFVAPTQKNVTAIGTMGYAPPELFAGRVEPRSDLYSLGATMFHLLTGRDPQDNPLLMFDFSRNPRPRDINPVLTEGIDQILGKSVEHKPANRFASAADMKEHLEEHLRSFDAPRVSIAPAAPPPSAGGAKIFCGGCGTELNASDLFCSKCGTPNITAKAAVPLTGSLLILGANNQPISIILTKDSNTLGRLDTNRGIIPDVDLTPFDKEGKVSRRHAIIHRDSNQFFIEDLGSTNGTYLNSEERLPPKEKFKVTMGDELRVGEVVMKFSVGTVPASFYAQQPKPMPAVTPSQVHETTVPNPPKSAESAAVAAGHRSEPAPPPPSFEPKLSGAASVQQSGSGYAKEQPLQPAPPVESHYEPAQSQEDSLLGIKKSRSSEPSKETLITEVDFPKQVKLGQVVELMVGLSVANGKSKKNPHEGEFEVTLAPTSRDPEPSAMIDAYIAAPGFEIEPEIFTRLNVTFDEDAIAVFQLKGLQAGPTTITIDFYQDPEYLSSVSVDSEVIE